MNFKKFISGLSALTLAVSGFVCVPVTVSAANTLYEKNAADWKLTDIDGESDDTWTLSGADSNYTITIDSGIKIAATKRTSGNGSEVKASKTFSTTTNADVTYTVNWTYGGYIARASGSMCYDYVQFGNLRLAYGCYRSGGNNLYRRYVSTDAGETYTEIGSVGNSTFTDMITLTVETSTGLLKSLSTTNFGNLNDYIGTTITNDNQFTFGYKGNTYNQYDFTTKLNSIKVTEEVPTEVPTIYHVYATDGTNIIDTIATGSAVNGASVSGYVRKVIEKEGDFYILDDESVTNYVKSFSMNVNNPDVNVTYTKDSSIVYFEELGTGTTSGYSGGGLGQFSGSSGKAYNASPGVYEVTIVAVSKGGSGMSFRGQHVGYDDTQIGDSIKEAGTYTITVNVAESGTIAVIGEGTSNFTDNLDYIMVKRIGDYTVESVTGNAEVVATSTEGDEDYKGSVFVATLAGNNNVSYSKLTATVTPAESTEKTATTKSSITTITGDGSIKIAIAIEGLRADEIEKVTVTLK